MRASATTVPVGVISVMPLREMDVAEHVTGAWHRGDGGTIVTVNVDILRAVTKDSSLLDLVADAEITVADGMPLVWAASVAGSPVPERVTGASLVSTLAAAAAASARSVYLIGGDPGIPEAAAKALAEQFPGLRIAGCASPPFGFEKHEHLVADLVEQVARTRPDLVLVGLGFPKQEKLIAQLRLALPRAWMLGCGAGIPMAAGQFARAPELVQRLGAEWLHRLVLEPRRLFRRYVLDDLPFAARLLSQALRDRLRTRSALAPAESLSVTAAADEAA